MLRSGRKYGGGVPIAPIVASGRRSASPPGSKNATGTPPPSPHVPSLRSVQHETAIFSAPLMPQVVPPIGDSALLSEHSPRMSHSPSPMHRQTGSFAPVFPVPSAQSPSQKQAWQVQKLPANRTLSYDSAVVDQFKMLRGADYIRTEGQDGSSQAPQGSISMPPGPLSLPSSEKTGTLFGTTFKVPMQQAGTSFKVPMQQAGTSFEVPKEQSAHRLKFPWHKPTHP